ncbi:putative thiazole/oxazole-modified microcin (TOMM)-like peptide [Kitasatospora sp. MAP12-15]|uniref:TIGR04351 family putative TOMM peptide n=1 Tax=unclassified Kitasatospora TaxID=2633591 RepID=UPI0024740032|nr:TIGR04351 family putative TOMM peptide [Kitasatospora sp. MAP12-44]MDH6110619.1 putative thiazole/oxazole-modified microcin (TOMM)-like peptide [Kitasatospora sp. MAP12-44]
MITATVPDAPSTNALECDWRFAELVVWTYLDPTLRTRYTVEPAAVLAEFGLLLPAGTAAPSLDGPAGGGLVITNADDLTAEGITSFCQVSGRGV